MWDLDQRATDGAEYRFLVSAPLGICLQIKITQTQIRISPAKVAGGHVCRSNTPSTSSSLSSKINSQMQQLSYIRMIGGELESDTRLGLLLSTYPRAKSRPTSAARSKRHRYASHDKVPQKRQDRRGNPNNITQRNAYPDESGWATGRHESATIGRAVSYGGLFNNSTVESRVSETRLAFSRISRWSRDGPAFFLPFWRQAASHNLTSTAIVECFPI